MELQLSIQCHWVMVFSLHTSVEHHQAPSCSFCLLILALYSIDLNWWMNVFGFLVKGSDYSVIFWIPVCSWFSVCLTNFYKIDISVQECVSNWLIFLYTYNVCYNSLPELYYENIFPLKDDWGTLYAYLYFFLHSFSASFQPACVQTVNVSSYE